MEVPQAPVETELDPEVAQFTQDVLESLEHPRTGEFGRVEGFRFIEWTDGSVTPVGNGEGITIQFTTSGTWSLL